MARIRTVKPELFTDPDLAACTVWARWLFVGLFTEADDKGRLIDSPKRLAGALFPHDEKVTAAKVKVWLDELVAIDSVVRYSDGNQQLLWIRHFNDHQKISHATPSKLPPHPEEIGSDSGDDTEDDQSDSGSEVEVGSGSGSGSGNSFADSGEKREPPPTFDDFWSVYPRRVDKGHARTAWNGAVRKTKPIVIIDGARRYATDPNLPAEKFRPYPATWLHGEQWLDGPQPSTLPAVNGGRVNGRDAGKLAILHELRDGA